MNFLAHLALAGPSDASLVGNLLGDFAKGTEAHLREQFPAEVVEGILMHRKIDQFTDAHPTFSQAKELLKPETKRFAGVVVDIFYDHFLSIHWNIFYPNKRKDFIEYCYTVLEKHPEWHSARFAEIFPYMRHQDWLGCYIEKSGIELTLQRVSQRSKFTHPIASSYHDFTSHYAHYEKLFLEFYPELQDYASQLAK